MLEYEEQALHGPLSRFIRCVWRFRGPTGTSPDLIPPDGHAEILFDLMGGPPQLVGHVATPSVASHSSGAIDLLGVRLQPAALGVLFGHPARVLSGAVHRLDEVCTLGDLAYLPERAPHEQLDIIDAWVRARLRRSDADDRLARAATVGLRTQTVRQTAQLLGTTERTLQRSFATFVGATPKEYFRTQRFIHAARALERGGATSDASAAYFDQAHFIREFKSFTGFTPNQYLQQQSHSIAMSVELGRGE